MNFSLGVEKYFTNVCTTLSWNIFRWDTRNVLYLHAVMYNPLLIKIHWCILSWQPNVIATITSYNNYCVCKLLFSNFYGPTWYRFWFFNFNYLSWCLGCSMIGWIITVTVKCNSSRLCSWAFTDICMWCWKKKKALLIKHKVKTAGYWLNLNCIKVYYCNTAGQQFWERKTYMYVYLLIHFFVHQKVLRVVVLMTSFFSSNSNMPLKARPLQQLQNQPH